MIDDNDDDDSSSSTRRTSFGHHFEEALNAEALPPSENDVDSSSKTDLQHSGWTSSEEDADPMDQGEEDFDSESRKSFWEHRKVHYDEFHKVKELRRNKSFLEEESDKESSIAAGVQDIDIKESSQANGT